LLSVRGPEVTAAAAAAGAAGCDTGPRVVWGGPGLAAQAAAQPSPSAGGGAACVATSPSAGGVAALPMGAAGSLELSEPTRDALESLSPTAKKELRTAFGVGTECALAEDAIAIDEHGHATVPDGVTVVGEGPFTNRTDLLSATLPDSVTTIGDHAFEGCSNLVLTSLPRSLTHIGSHAFADCSALALTSLPAGVTWIADGAFWDCTSLALTSLPPGVTFIGECAFFCLRPTKLALTSLPASLTYIGDGAFSGQKSLALTSLPACLTVGEGAFRGCTGLHPDLRHEALRPFFVQVEEGESLEQKEDTTESP
jgi:hypothetical protein